MQDIMHISHHSIFVFPMIQVSYLKPGIVNIDTYYLEVFAFRLGYLSTIEGNLKESKITTHCSDLFLFMDKVWQKLFCFLGKVPISVNKLSANVTSI